MKRQLNVITCPHCGKEYLPAEIFIPSAFFGYPDIIRRDSEGKIIDFLGSDMDLDELYCCDNCNKPFNITASVAFHTKIDDKLDISTPYTTIMSSRFELAEN